MTNGQSDRNANPQQGGAGYPQHLWPDYAQAPADPAWQAQAPTTGRAKGSALFGVLALIAGLAAVAAPLAPTDMSGYRQYAAFPFAFTGFALAIAGLIGNRRGIALAAIGGMFSLLAFAIGVFMVVTYR